ncbi:piggyBac transposable element-derived protein 4-like [Athalia rosae]|uniref:piggyBac transposable element-derived protein 4-like n=1 Tax=Athalia rosae TaxID=37344 RepID=UPI002033DAEC|nr:piggyBac transposable element-derived protein 4-like [Athalia rosae]
MASEKEDTVIRDECVDILSDVPSEFEDFKEVEDIASSEKENEATSSDESEICRRKIRQPMPLPSDTEESDEDNGIDWSDLDLPRNNNDFEGSFGPNILSRDATNIEDVVELFIGNDLFEFICTETNRYYDQNSTKRKPDKESRKFFNVTPVELKKWFGLVILMGIIKKPKIDDYWSTNPLLETPIFGKTMSRNRFRQMLTFLHFCDNSNIPDNADRLFKVQGVIDYFTKKFEENFNLGQNISIDEGMIPWRGRLSFKVYNPSKITKYGILIRMLCDSMTGYISRFQIYSGSKIPSKDTVTKLLKNVSGKWHHLYMDNYYNSVDLAEDLLIKKIRVCGTLRQNRGLPAKLKNCKLNLFETKYQRRGAVLAQIWKPTKAKMIRIISTIHNGGLVDTTKKYRKTNSTIKKPASILDYNKYMKGVDRADQFLCYYPIYRKTIKWSKKVALYLFNCALYNAFVVQQYYSTDSKKLHFYDFLLKISESWIKDHSPVGEENLEVPSTSRASSRGSINRLSGHVKEHQLIRISETNNRKRRRCHVCYKNKKIKRTNLMYELEQMLGPPLPDLITTIPDPPTPSAHITRFDPTNPLGLGKP